MVVTDAPWVVEPAGVVTPVPIVASGVLAPDPFVLANAVAEKMFKIILTLFLRWDYKSITYMF